jgi:ELWxxDGT repeat protein
MQYTASPRDDARTIITALLLLVCAASASGADIYNGTTLRIPALTVGSSSLSNVVVVPAAIVNVNSGAASGSADSYNPASGQLTAPSVLAGASTYNNVILTLASLVSIGSVAGADSYNGTVLSIPSVQILGGPVYTNVVVTIGTIVSAGGGMPATIRDVYNPASKQLTVALAQVGSKVYTNAVITVGAIQRVGGSLPPASVLFTDNAGLWSLNESSGQVTQLAAGAGDVNGVAFQAGSMAVTGGKAYFAGGDANNPLGLFVSNGSVGGTSLVHTFAPGNGQAVATLAEFTPLANGSALFVYFAGDGTQSLWMSNGSGVTEVTVAGAGTPYSNASGVFPSINLGPGQSGELAGNLLFTDNTGLWSLNESSGQVTKIAAGTADVNGVAFAAGSLAVTGGKAYFAGGDASNPLNLYVSNGTSGGTSLVRSFTAGNGQSIATIADLTPLANGGAVFVYFAGDATQTLWMTNGNGAAEVTITGTGTPYSNASGAFPSINLGPGQSGEIAGHLLFTDTAGLWSLNESNGQVTELATGSGDANGVAFQAGSLAVSDGKAYFAAGDANNPFALYVSDGTIAGTGLVRTFAGGNGQSIPMLADFTSLANGAALFVYFAGDGTQSLWTTYGSGATEVSVAGSGTPYSNASGDFPAINLGPGQSGTP